MYRPVPNFKNFKLNPVPNLKEEYYGKNYCRA